MNPKSDELPSELCKANVVYKPMAVLVHRCDRSVGYCRTGGHEFGITEETSAVGKPKVVVSLRKSHAM